MYALLEKLLNAATEQRKRAKAEDDFFNYQGRALLTLISDGYMGHFNNRGLMVTCCMESKKSDYGKYLDIRVGAYAKPTPGAPAASVRLTLHVQDMAERVATVGLRPAARHYTDMLCTRVQRQLDCPRPPATPHL
jgi:hypothetical protein